MESEENRRQESEEKHPIMLGSHILGPPRPIISFPRNFTKDIYFNSLTCFWFSSVRYFQIAQKKYLCKNASELIRYVTTGPKCQVHYTTEIVLETS